MTNSTASRNGSNAALAEPAGLPRHNGHSASGRQRTLLPQHLADLRTSGLADEIIAAAGIYSVTDANELAAILGWRQPSRRLVPALAFPFLGAGGNTGYIRVKPDAPRRLNGNVVKYESPRGRPNEIYLPPGTLSVLADANFPLLLTEGEKKALSADQHGFPTVGIVGVWGWKTANSETLLPGLERIVWQGRDVFIVFDSDAASKPDIQAAEARLALQLQRHGANVKIVRLPPGPPDSSGQPTKVGLDDYLLVNSADALQELLASAIDPRELPTPAIVRRAKDADPNEEVQEYIERQKTDGISRLVFWRGAYWRWEEGRYLAQTAGDVQAALVKHLQGRVTMLGTREAANCMMHLRAMAALAGDVEPPCWIAPVENAWSGNEVLACRNSIIHLPSLIANGEYSRPATPRFFAPAALEFDFALDAPEPMQWLMFLNSLWPDQPDCITTLQEWFGYCLTPDTSLQKMLYIIGPKRSGKGTIARILQQLVGAQNVAGPTLASLTTNFGLAPLLGKTLATISDARLSGRADVAALVERLLSISGEDTLTIDKKHQEAVTIKLLTRIVLLSNELPRITDASNALTSRLIILPLTQSWFGREDTALTNRLTAELPGILLWAIEGWRRLRARGHFVEPATAGELREDLERLTSPISTFVRECCQAGPGFAVQTQAIYDAYRLWCVTAGQHPDPQPVFARNLRAAVSGIRGAQPRVEGRRVRHYEGIGLLAATALNGLARGR